MGEKPAQQGQKRLPSPTGATPTKGTEARRRKGMARNRTLLTQGLGGNGVGASQEKKGLLGE